MLPLVWHLMPLLGGKRPFHHLQTKHSLHTFMARIVKKPGDILKFPLSDREQHGYAQWLPDGTARVFLASCESDLSVDQVLGLPVAFRVLVFNDTPNRYGWSKVGKGATPEAYMHEQRYAKKDSISGKLSIYFQGKESSATMADVTGLETLAVWAHPHIIERLEAQLDGKESLYLRVLNVLA